MAKIEAQLLEAKIKIEDLEAQLKELGPFRDNEPVAKSDLRQTLLKNLNELLGQRTKLLDQQYDERKWLRQQSALSRFAAGSATGNNAFVLEN